MAKPNYKPVPHFNPTDTATIWAKVDKRLPDECWPWKGNVDQKGYGRICINYKSYYAPRVIYAISYGDCPADLMICHHCDNPICCNPLHLFLGTAKDNTTDCLQKNRHRFGERHAHAKFTDEIAQSIRHLYFIEKVSQRELARQFNVTRSAIANIVRGTGWHHLPAISVELQSAERDKKRGADAHNAKLTEADVKQIRQLYSTGNWRKADLARRFNVGHANIAAIINRRIWKHLTD